MPALRDIRGFREYLRLFEREIEKQNNSVCCCGVSLQQCHTLMELDREDNVTLKSLSERLHTEKSTLSRIIEGLVQLSYVSRDIPQNNRRTVLIRLTKQGRSVCDRINRNNDDYFQKVFNSFSDSELNDFIDSFKKVTTSMSEENATKLEDKNRRV